MFGMIIKLGLDLELLSAMVKPMHLKPPRWLGTRCRYIVDFCCVGPMLRICDDHLWSYIYIAHIMSILSVHITADYLQPEKIICDSIDMRIQCRLRQCMI